CVVLVLRSRDLGRHRMFFNDTARTELYTLSLHDALPIWMTTNSFCRYFKQKMGKTLIQLVHELRIAHACKLLENNHLSIKEICFECGFQNFVSFHKSFKQIVGIPPNSYRLSKK